MTPLIRKLLESLGPGHRAEGLALLALEARRLVEADVSLSLAEWRTLAPDEQEAVALARRGERALRMVNLGSALQGGRAAAVVLGDHDGGATEERLALQEAHAAAFPRRVAHGQ